MRKSALIFAAASALVAMAPQFTSAATMAKGVAINPQAPLVESVTYYRSDYDYYPRYRSYSYYPRHRYYRYDDDDYYYPRRNYYYHRPYYRSYYRPYYRPYYRRYWY